MNNAQANTPESILQRLTTANENIWNRMGTLYEQLGETARAEQAYDNALRHNPYNARVLTRLAAICRAQKQYPKAIEQLLRLLDINSSNGEVWSELGHCYLMTDELQKAFTAYQNALYNLQNPKDIKLWYGIGILYDRYGSYEHAEEAFTAVLRIEPNFEKASEIHFRLGIIYKQQSKYDQSLQCFRDILSSPPPPLSQADIWFQIGHVHELKGKFDGAKEAYERVLKMNANHAKVLQQLGWLYHHNQQWGNQDVAISYLTRSIDADPGDGQTWYLLGRCYMTLQKYRKAYDAYQQAVYRDGRNPTFWCSIGVLYYQINQYRDALDAYSRAIQLNPFLSEVWYDLGTLYESCKQLSDSLDAYQRAAQLDPNNEHIQERLAVLRASMSQGGNGGNTSDAAAPKPAPAEPQVGNSGMQHRDPNPSLPPGGLNAASIPSVSKLVDGQAPQNGHSADASQGKRGQLHDIASLAALTEGAAAQLRSTPSLGAMEPTADGRRQNSREESQRMERKRPKLVDDYEEEAQEKPVRKAAQAAKPILQAAAAETEDDADDEDIPEEEMMEDDDDEDYEDDEIKINDGDSDGDEDMGDD